MENGSYGGYDGGHIGSDGGSFSNSIYYQNDHSLYKPVPPPLTAIDRFLWGRTQYNQTQTLNQKSNEPFVSSNGVLEFSSYGSGINNGSRICLPPYIPMTNNFMVDDYGDLFVNNIGECLSYDEHRSYPNFAQNRESNQVIEPEKVFTNSVKKPKGGAISKVLIKGQWTEEEDSKLIRLVKHYGEQKWALVAQKMAGRTGKQCRERWRNHLRPDIKKDEWSEEEVKMLIIEAHQKVGNKWAVIAKLIPGRTENSIKNQWNATKRKQISSRKNKKNGTKNKKPQYTLLQEYVRSKTSDQGHDSSSNTITITTTNSTIIPELSKLNNNDLDPSIEITQTNNDELDFMQTFFQTTNSSEISSHVEEPKSPTISLHIGFSSFSPTLNDENSNMYFNNYPEEDSSKADTALDFNHSEETNAMPSSNDQSCHGDGSTSSAKKIWIW